MKFEDTTRDRDHPQEQGQGQGQGQVQGETQYSHQQMTLKQEEAPMELDTADHGLTSTSNSSTSSSSPDTGIPEYYRTDSNGAVITNSGNTGASVPKSTRSSITSPDLDFSSIDNAYSDNSSSNAKRKRKRLTISCLTCRKRKIKCDRQKPCSSCIKNNVPAHLCVYDESPWVSTLIKDNKMTDELRSLKQENCHLNDLLKMNELELNNLKSLLLDLKIGQSKDHSTREASPEVVQGFLSDEEAKEHQLLDQPINIGAFSCYKQTTFAVKVFGPSTWQNFVQDDLKTSYMLDINIPYIMDLISKNQRRNNQAKMVKLRMLGDSKIDESKLKEIEEELGEYEKVYLNLQYFGSVYNAIDALKFIDFESLMYNFSRLITRDDENGCQINLDLNLQDSHVDVAYVAIILLVLKLSLIFQDVKFQVDVGDHLVSYAAELFSSMMVLEQPSVPAVLALTIFQTYQLYNPMDFGAEVIPHGTSRDYSMLLMIAVNSALKLGIHTRSAPKYDRHHYNYISPYHLREFWRATLMMDFITSFNSGLPLAMAGYCDILERTDESILLKVNNETDVTLDDYIKHRKIVSLRSLATNFTTTNQNSSKMSLRKDLVKSSYILKKMVLETRKTNHSILKILEPCSNGAANDLLVKAISLDVLISISYTLFITFSNPGHILNSNVDKGCFQRNNNQLNFQLVKRYFNETLMYIVYALRFGAWFFQKSHSDPFWAEDLVHQFVVLKSIKQVTMKSLSLLLILFIRNSSMNQSNTGLHYGMRFNQPRAQTFDLFHSDFTAVDRLVWEDENKYENYNFETETVLKDSIELTVRIFKAISAKRSSLTIDRKWFISMELCYTSMLFCFDNCPVAKTKFNAKDYSNVSDFEAFKEFYNIDTVYPFRRQNYQKNKKEIMKVASLLN